jgi:tellurite resistance protein
LPGVLADPVQIVIGLLILGPPLPDRLTPTLAILVAPPAVAFLSYLRLGGHATEPMARILLGVAVFQTLLLAVQVPSMRRIGFYLSWWALSFPLAAVTIALLAGRGPPDRTLLPVRAPVCSRS